MERKQRKTDGSRYPYEKDMLELEEAQERILNEIRGICEVEQVCIDKLVNRVLAEDIIAKYDQPPFPRSPLDGYAVRSRDTVGANVDAPVSLCVTGEIMAGQSLDCEIEYGLAVRIMTGAPIPEGTDCVIKQENTDCGEQIVQIYTEMSSGQNYCHQGEDYKKGDCLLPRGTILGPAEIGVIASTGMMAVSCYRKPRVLLFSTGDELAVAGDTLKKGQIYDANLYMIWSQFSKWEVEIVEKDSMGDDPQMISSFIRKHLSRADIVVTTGGVSVGKKDIMHDVFELLGVRRIFWGIAIKPGMPTLVGELDGKLLLCLSGNPYGAIANLHLLVRPAIAAMSRRTDLDMIHLSGQLLCSYEKASPVRRFIRAFYNQGKVSIGRNNDSGLLGTLVGCNCLIDVPAGTDLLKAGQSVRVMLL